MNPARSRAAERGVMLLAVLLAAGSAFGADATVTGQLTAFGSYGVTKSGSVLREFGGRTLLDHTLDLRLMVDAPLGADVSLQVHDDLATTGGDTRAAETRSGLSGFDVAAGPNDERRLVDLTDTIHRGPRALTYQRIDRMALHWTPDWGAVTVGRTAVTWGNGLIFNVQDLFNPFDPRDFVRDYKTGDDLALVETRAGGADWQFLAVPRRDPDGGRFSATRSSLAAHVRFEKGDTEWTGFAGVHYDQPVAGVGRVATVGEGIWRSDVLLSRKEDGGIYLAGLTNFDRSWVWAGRNCYGLIEAHFNNLGHGDPERSLLDPEVMARLSRGEIFTLGRAYLAGMLQVEFHPLLDGAVTVITDLSGPSAFVQPRFVWNAREDLQVIFGAQVAVGARGTEYGGIVDPGTGLTLLPGAAAFLRLTAWF